MNNKMYWLDLNVNACRHGHAWKLDIKLGKKTANLDTGFHFDASIRTNSFISAFAIFIFFRIKFFDDFW